MNGRRCPYCQQVFQPARYHPQQLVCSQAQCQRRRRREYHRQKLASDPVYRQVCRGSSQKWREADPGYWKQYRQVHPRQVECNRQRQHRRDQKRRLLNLANNNLAIDLKHSAAEVWLLGPSRDFSPSLGTPGRAGLQPRRNRGSRGVMIPCRTQLAAASCVRHGTQE